LTFLLLLSLPACDNVPLSLEVEAAEQIIAADGFENEEIDVNSEETKLDEIEYKTIEPPEDGWTLELLNEVTYINGKDIDLPFCLNDLGEDFSFGDVTYYDFGGKGNYKSGQYIYYKGKKAFLTIAKDNDGKFDEYDIITEIVLSQPDNESELDLEKFFVLNGYGVRSDRQTTIDCLGNSYEIYGNNQLHYKFGNVGNRLVALFPANDQPLNPAVGNTKQVIRLTFWGVEDE
jgi:hypothetical protein